MSSTDMRELRSGKRLSEGDMPAYAPAPSDWRKYRRARDLAWTVFPVSEAVILAAARKHGIGRKMGRAIIFSSEDTNQLYEALPCLSGASGGRKRLIGSSAAPSAASELKKARALLSERGLRKSAPREKSKSSPNPSSVVPLRPRSRRPAAPTWKPGAGTEKEEKGAS